jgi:glyoxylase-like metal-dependent hydrolase (beta-lactamase superfamily II)
LLNHNHLATYMNKIVGVYVVLVLNLFISTQIEAQEFEFKYPRTSVEMELKQVSEHVYFAQGAAGMATENQGFISNATIILDNHGITIIDALGSPSLAEQMLYQLRKISSLPVKRVITTHYHADHIYGLQVFEAIGAEILAPFGVDDYLNSEAAKNRLEERRLSLDPWVSDETHLVHPDLLIDKPLIINEGGVKLTINILGKAHSDADLTVLVEPDNVFISGDVIVDGRIPFVGDSDSKAWLKTLTRMADKKDIKALIPGHGDMAKDPIEAIARTRNYLAYLRDNLSVGVEEMMSFDELYESIDWTPFRELPAFKEGNRINAYQVFLSLEKEMLEQ